MKNLRPVFLAALAAGASLVLSSCHPADEGVVDNHPPGYPHSHPQAHEGVPPNRSHIHANGASKNHLKKPFGYPTFASAINNRHRRGR